MPKQFSAIIKEYDGGREIELAAASNFVFLEAGGRSYAFDRGVFLHAVKRALGIAYVIDEGVFIKD